MKEIFKKLITDFQERNLSDIFPREIEVDFNSGKILSLVGVRRSGKTSCMFALANALGQSVSKENLAYINFEDDRLFPLQLSNLDALVQGYYELYPDKKSQQVTFFLDEVQTVPQWEKFVRRLHDTEQCTVCVSGSSSSLLGHEIATSLRGRSLTYEIFPLSFREYLMFQGIKPNLYSSSSLAKIRHAFDKYLNWGGFPEIVSMSEPTCRKTLQSYLDLIIYRDIVERHSITNTFLLKHIIKHCFSNLSSLMSVNKLFQDLKSQGLKISKNTLHQYLGYLEDAYALFRVPIASQSAREQMRNPHKIYGIDVGLHRLFEPSQGRNIGHMLENIVFLECRRSGYSIRYLKSTQEVDFLIQSPAGHQLINVCSSLHSFQTRQREIRGMLQALEQLTLDEGLIVSLDHEETVLEQGKTIHITPAWKWILDMPP